MFSSPFISVVNLIYFFCGNNSNNWSWSAIFFFYNIRLILLIFCLEFLHLYLWVVRLIYFMLPLLSVSVSIIPSLFKELRNNPAFSVLWWDWNYVFLDFFVECSFKTIRVWYFMGCLFFLWKEFNMSLNAFLFSGTVLDSYTWAC